MSNGFVVGEHGAAVAIATQRLGGEEGRSRYVSHRAGHASVVNRAEALRTVVDHGEAILARNG